MDVNFNTLFVTAYISLKHSRTEQVLEKMLESAELSTCITYKVILKILKYLFVIVQS